MIQLSEQFVPIKLDAEKGGKPAAQKYGVQGYPTILFVDGDGNVVVRTAGYQPPKDFAAMMNRVLDLKHLPDWEAGLQKDPSNRDFISKLGLAAALKGDEAGAQKYADMAMKVSPNNEGDAFDDLYNAVGDMFQNENKLTQAIPFFNETATTGKDTDKVAYALISIAVCDLQSNQFQLALDATNKAAALPGLSKDDAATIAGLKAAAQKALSSKP